ncbi:hypothetical protein NIES39_A00210 [Arthrospira platensis NIES-39]|nr:hypothetical protein NIES39_A00210 [Arthrospira platensis NIES-39]
MWLRHRIGGAIALNWRAVEVGKAIAHVQFGNAGKSKKSLSRNGLASMPSGPG